MIDWSQEEISLSKRVRGAQAYRKELHIFKEKVFIYCESILDASFSLHWIVLVLSSTGINAD